jgi:hypothetical protein
MKVCHLRLKYSLEHSRGVISFDLRQLSPSRVSRAAMAKLAERRTADGNVRHGAAALGADAEKDFSNPFRAAPFSVIICIF